MFDRYGIGLTFLAIGLFVASLGFWLCRKFHFPADDGPRFYPAGSPLCGLMVFLGYVLVVFGLSAVTVGIMVLLL